MVNDITQLLSPTLLFMLFCYFVTLVLRKICEGKWSFLKANDDWKVFLQVFPVLVGTVCAYVPKYPIPAAFIASAYSKGMWGFVAGALSTWAYDIFQAMLKRLFGIDINTLKKSTPPASMVPPTPPVVVPPPASLPSIPKGENHGE